MDASPNFRADDVPLQQARAQLLELAQPPQLALEPVALRAALDRVLGTDLHAAIDMPPYDNAAMDGYALRHADLAAGVPLRRVGAALAGHAHDAALPEQACVRITTGAVLPPQADTVVPQELCQVDGDSVRVDAPDLAPGANVRRRGDDCAAGARVLAAGRRLRAADLAMLAALGFETVPVRPRLKVAIVSSGDELCPPGRPLAPGSVYDSNRVGLDAMLQRLGCTVIDLGTVADDPAALRAALLRGCREADVVLSSGGVGVGDADHLKAVMAELGQVANRRLALRPGRPLAFGRIGSDGHQALLIGLPGNPVAVVVTFHVVVRDALLQMMGAVEREQPLLPVTLLHDLPKKPGRTELPRARLVALPDGGWGADCRAPQGSGAICTLSQSDALLVLEHARGPLRAGDAARALLLDRLI